MNTAFLLTGGNMGDRLGNLQEALSDIEKQTGTVIKKSSLYETAAWGLQDQPAFLNQVLHIETPLQAEDLLKVILHIEEDLGRKRLLKMGPRTIDIDILFFNNDIISSADLTVPHPRLQDRRFVLTPLNEIASDYLHPVLNKTIAELLQICTDELQVELYRKPE